MERQPIRVKKSSVTSKATKAVAIATMSAAAIFGLTSCNQEIIDLTYKFDAAVIVDNGVATIVPLKAWKDYPGEQIQLTTKDGTKLLTSSFRTTLVNSKATSAHDVARALVGRKGEVVELKPNLANEFPANRF